MTIRPGGRRETGRRSRGGLRVLVVDDSAVVRQVMNAVLSRESDMTVVAAADPLIALRKMRRERPDVILLDLEMPRMDGLSFLRRIMRTDPVPVVVCSSVAGRGTEKAMQALDEGAVEIVEKPKLGIRDFLEDSSVRLVDALRAAANARLKVRAAPRTAVPRRLRPSVTPRLPVEERIVAIGASTGGTVALRKILSGLPADGPGIVAVQHMPSEFTAAFARRLDGVCAPRVKEAAPGDRVRPGTVLLAPGDRHLRVRRRPDGCVVDVTGGPLVSRHRPSVDVLFRSVAAAAGPSAIGVILTGMGVDGAAGLLELREAGGTTFAQDERSCVVFGMPREAIRRGAVDEVVPLWRMASALLMRTA